jgi:amino-acid N-acetyltransferase
MNIRKAVIGDIKPIHEILNFYADQGLLLPRSLSELYDHLRDYFVLEEDDQNRALLAKRGDRAGQAPSYSNLERRTYGPDDSHPVAGQEQAGGWNRIDGVCGLGICWEELAEIRSLAVSVDKQGKGFGSRLVAACLEEARSLGLSKVFTLTYVPSFFVRFGFKEVEKLVLPHKIWADCLKCHKFPNCDETALMLDL